MVGNHIFQHAQAGPAAGFLAAGAGLIDLGRGLFDAGITQGRLDVAVGERIAQAHIHGVSNSDSALSIVQLIIIRNMF